MGYSEEHVKATRARIVESAGRFFRRLGFAGAGVDAIMNDAGLTRGGFYAHFRSKRSLFDAVAAEPLGFTEQIRRCARSDHPGRAVCEAIGWYLGESTFERAAAACTMAAASGDLARGPASGREAFAPRLAELVEALADACDCEAEAAQEATLACVGAISLARALPAGDHRSAVLASGRQLALSRLGLGGD